MSDNVNNPRKDTNINFVGNRVMEARLSHVKWRVTMRDGVGQMATCDVRFDRYNFEVENGIITRQYMG